MTGRNLPPQPRIVLSNGKRPCRGCGGEVPKGRMTWCGNECRDKHYMALSSYARRKVFERDGGLCALCGADAGLAQRIINRLWWKYGRRASDEVARRAICAAWGVSSWSWSPTLWEADHIVPLAEGGTNELGNYRTLCLPCHKNETRALRRRLSRAGRQQELSGAPMKPQDICSHDEPSEGVR